MKMPYRHKRVLATMRSWWRNSRSARIIRKSADWAANIFLAVCCYYVLKYFVLLCVGTTGHVPSDSMQPTFKPGDMIWIDKTSLGARVLNLWEDKKLDDHEIWRLPAIGKLKRNDLLLFNYPYLTRHGDSIAQDVTTHYLKRCIALPGDTLEIINCRYVVNGNDSTVGHIDNQLEMRRRLAKERKHFGKPYSVHLPVLTYAGDTTWTVENAGPFIIPRTGMTIEMTPHNVIFYERYIEWENRKSLRLDSISGTVTLGDSIIDRYTFKEDYFFAGGDNVAASRDSRYIGFVPYKFIIGKVVLIWWSTDEHGTGDINWHRVLTRPQ